MKSHTDFNPGGYLSPAVSSEDGPQTVLIASTCIPPWGGLPFGTNSTSGSGYFMKGTEIGIALFSSIKEPLFSPMDPATGSVTFGL